MTTNKAAEALLAAWHEEKGPCYDSPRCEHGLPLAAIIAEATAQKDAEVALLTEALEWVVESIDYCHKTRHLRHADQPRGLRMAGADCYCSVTESVDAARAALAAAPAVAPDPAPPAPDERCAGCGEDEDHPAHRTEYRDLSFHPFQPEPAP